MNLRPQKYRLFDNAFTLIELLAVIAIIGIITAMIVNLAPAVSAKQKRSRVQVEKQNLITMIDSYKAKFGHYPTDNANLQTLTQPLDPDNYDVYTQVNPLYYELGGGSNNVTKTGSPGGTYFIGFDTTNVFAQSDIATAYGIQGIVNADQEMQPVYRAPATGHTGYPTWMVGGKSISAQGLTVPIDMTQWSRNSPSKYTPTSVNFWHYDASSIFRHNPNSYDLWAVYVIKRLPTPPPPAPQVPVFQYATNGNW